MKKISILLVLLMLVLSFPFVASAESDFVIDASGNMTDYTGTGGVVVIPKEVKNIWAGFGSKALTTVTFEAGSQLEYIGQNAFPYVTTEYTITLPDKAGIMIEDWSFYTGSIVNITIPNTSTVINGNNAFNQGQYVRMSGKNASPAEIYCSNSIYWLFTDLEYTVSGGWLDNYTGIGGELVIPKEVSYIYGTVLNNKNITKISFEAGSQLIQFGDGGNFILTGNTDVQIVLPVKEGITIKAYSLWGDASQITDPNLTTVYEASSVWTGRVFNIIAPANSSAKTYFDTVVATGVTWWTFQTYATAANAYTISYPIDGLSRVSGFGVQKTLADFMLGVTKGSSVEIKAYNEITELLSTEFIGTGTTIRVNNGITTTDYHAIIMGDLTGDGRINVDDLATMKGYLLQTHQLSGYKFTAGEFHVIGKITISDVLLLKKHLLGIVTIAN